MENEKLIKRFRTVSRHIADKIEQLRQQRLFYERNGLPELAQSCEEKIKIYDEILNKLLNGIKKDLK